ncbi:MAG: hypothetical protein ISS61_03790 [Desulfobacteraceae bacterium]|nr:hypothetical protein [Desulfobacteraceae bacterium]
MAEKEKLGIFVATNKHLDHVIGVVKAAKKAGKELVIFLTHDGVLMSQDPKYQELADLGPEEMTLCNVRWEELGLKGKPIPAGMGEKGLATQSRHVSLIGKCDRYLVL